MLPAIFAPADFGKFVQLFERIAARSRRIAGASTRRFILQADANEQHAFAIVHRLRGFHADGLALARKAKCGKFYSLVIMSGR